MQISHGAHVAVADGRKFLLLRNAGDETLPVLDVDEVEVQDDAATREIGTDSPGRTFSGTAAGGAEAAGHRSAYSQPDYHQQGEDAFAADRVKQLNELVKRGRISQLIIVAPPKALGEMRKHYDKALEAVLVGEIAKEMTNLPPDEIAAAVADG